MQNAIRTIILHKAIALPVVVVASLAGFMLGSWWLLLPASIMAGLLALFVKFVNPAITTADRDYWTVPQGLVVSLMDEFESIMQARGYAKANYMPDVHDCDDYALAGIVTMHGLLMRERYKYQEANGKADPLFLFSFQRDNGQRHRVFFVSTDKGRLYVDSWRINGSMFRTLSNFEELNGRIV